MNHLNTASRLGKIKLFLAYEHKVKRKVYFRANKEFLSHGKPIYEEFNDIKSCKTYEEFSFNARKYIEENEKLTNTKIEHIDTGIRRNDITIRKE